ncbi:hypothetical protein SAMN04488688_10636 [Paenibacillus sp. cl141a]|nr:hypothetical protein SAMN04488688_10636 [Paenibacillus sp. cl141a]
MDVTKSVDISIMLGLGDRHGKAAVEWTVDNLLSTYQVMENHCLRTVASFSAGSSVPFGRKIGRKKVYRFPFSDQSTLSHTMGVSTVSTRLGFDSIPLTSISSKMPCIRIAPPAESQMDTECCGSGGISPG